MPSFKVNNATCDSPVANTPRPALLPLLDLGLSVLAHVAEAAFVKAQDARVWPTVMPNLFDGPSYASLLKVKGLANTLDTVIDQNLIVSSQSLLFFLANHSDALVSYCFCIGYTALSLDRFSGWGVGYNTGVDVKRNHLERLLQQLRQERRATELRAWDDLVRMRRELTDAVKE